MRHPFALACAVLAGLWAVAGPARAQESHPFGALDLVTLERLSDPQLSPDGTQVAFVLRSTDLEADRGRTDLWLVDVAGGEPLRLTTHEANDLHPRWTPDGKALLFLSSRGGSDQVWRLDLAGGEAQPVTDVEGDVSDLLVFPDGQRILFAAEVDPTPSPADEDAPSSSAQVYDALPVRHWDTWEDGRRRHLFVWRIGSEEPPVDLMKGWEADAPTRPFGGTEELSIAPDGSEVAFVARPLGSEAAWSTNTDVWVVPADGSGEPRALSADNLAADTYPSFSPDGRWLVWAAMARPGFEADRLGLVLQDRRSGEQRVLAPDWDRSVAELAWLPDSSGLLVGAADLGHTSLFGVDLAEGGVAELVDRGTNASPLRAGDRLLYLHDDLRSPAELWSAAADGSDATPLTAFNAERLALARTGEYEQFSFPGWNGETVHGFVVKPVDFEEGKRYPVAFLIHGGPQNSFGNHFHYRWNPQVYAGAGYAAVMIDFHGSVGYGQAFTDSISEDWGGKPYQDLMRGLDVALKRYPFLDGERVAALGASYGGYMVNWIAGQTDRFRCLVNHDGVFDTRAMYFGTEELWFIEWEHGGPPWEAAEAYDRFNPALHVDRWNTPMLVAHGALDYRVPETQGLGAFTALQRRGVPSRLLYFPDENHFVLKPGNSLRWHQEVLAWIDRWTRDPE